MPKILIIDDSRVQRAMIGNLVSQLGYDFLEATGGQDAIDQLRADTGHSIAAALLDLTMPDIDGKQALPQMLAICPGLSVIVVTGTQVVTDVVEMIKMGATDYIVKPPNHELLRNALAKAVNLHNLHREVMALRDAHAASEFGKIIGESAGIRNAIKLARKAAASDITIFITGESGVGKEVLAQAVHKESSRTGKPFVAINCGAIPKDLVESTLFGHKKGSFTGAVADALGKFREADGGTLFLDEIGELPLESQAKLLRALQEREVQPVGSNKAVPVNIRIIAATNRNPMQAVQKGHLREDLFYRLNVFPIHIPPLRERADDISTLAEFFLKRYAELENKNLTGFTPDAQQWLKQHNWPGNVRELENTLFRAVLLCDDTMIDRSNLVNMGSTAHQPVNDDRIHQIELLGSDGEFKPLATICNEIEEAALVFYKDNTTLAAQRLGIGKSTLYRHKKV